MQLEQGWRRIADIVAWRTVRRDTEHSIRASNAMFAIDAGP